MGLGKGSPEYWVTGTRIARYLAVPPKIDRRRSIEGEKKKKKRKRRKKKKRRRRTYFPRDILARASSPPSPAGNFSPAVSSCGEKDRGD
ncbi:hypothetical protein B296_00057336, partial [Ensete ventricosum]